MSQEEYNGDIIQEFSRHNKSLHHKEEKIRFLQALCEKAQKNNLQAHLLSFQANILYLKEDYKPAIKTCNKAIELDSDFALPWYTLGLIYQDRGLNEQDKIENCYRKAVEIDPGFAYPWNALGYIYLKLKQFDGAAECLEQAIRLDPDYAPPWNGLGKLYLDLNELAKAEACLDRAREIDPKYSSPWDNLGKIFARTGQREKAIEHYNKAAELDPADGHPYRDLGLLFLKERNYTEAKRFFEQALEKFRNDHGNIFILSSLEARIQNINELLNSEEELKYKKLNKDPIFKILTETINQGIEDRVIKNKNTLSEFIEEKTGEENGGIYLEVLRKWNSFTPIIVEDYYASKGGGYFVKVRGKGIVIDPGFNFIDNFKRQSHKFHEIDYILVSHAHNDHTADLESILTLLYLHNQEIKDSENPSKDNTIRNELAIIKNVPPGQVSKKEIEETFLVSSRRKLLHIYLTASVFKKYMGLFELFSKSDYRVHILEDGSSRKVGDIEIQVIKAKHNDILSDSFSVGYILHFDDAVLVYTGDTGWSEEIEEQYRRVEKDCRDKYRLLLAHLGGFKEHERYYLDEKLRHKAFYSNHLGRLGLARINEVLKPDICLISEFGEEFKGNRIKVAGIFQEAFENEIIFLPAGVGLTLDLVNKKVKAITEVDLEKYRTGFGYIDPAGVGVCELRKSFSLHYFDRFGAFGQTDLMEVLMENYNRALSGI